MKQYFVDNPEQRQRVADDLAEWRAQNPGAASENIRRAHREHPESFLKSPETREKIAAGQSAFWNGPDGDDARAEASRLRKEMWAKDPEYGQKIMATKASRMEEYRRNGGYGSPEWSGKISTKITELIEAGDYWARGRYHSPKAGEVPYRSSWELLRMAELDADPAVISWEYEAFHIPYDFNGRARRYIPDFKAIMDDGTVLVEEIGPRSVKLSPRNSAKRSALEKFCNERGWRMRWPST